MAIEVHGAAIQSFNSYSSAPRFATFPPGTVAGDIVVLSFGGYGAATNLTGWTLLHARSASYYGAGYTWWKVVTAGEVTAGGVTFTSGYVDTGRYSLTAMAISVGGAGGIAVLGSNQGANYYYYGTGSTPWVTALNTTVTANPKNLVAYLFSAQAGYYATSFPPLSPPPTSSRGNVVASRSGVSGADPHAAAIYTETLVDPLPPTAVATTYPQTGSNGPGAGWYMIAVAFEHPKIIGTGSQVEVSQSGGDVAMGAAARLNILDPYLIQAPTALTVTMDSLIPNVPVRFYIDGMKVYEAEVGDEYYLGPTSLPISETVGTAGTHALTASQTGGEVQSATFTIEKPPTLTPATRGPDANPVPIPGAVTAHGTRKWVLQDLMPGGLGSYVMPVSPFEMDNPEFERLLSAQHTTALSGQYHVYEGGYAPLEWSFKGYVPTQEMHDKLIAFANLNRRFYLIDHRNRAWKVAFAGIDMVPRLRQVNIYGVMTDSIYDYEASVLIYDQEWTTP